jgi:hypothetical protein
MASVSNNTVIELFKNVYGGMHDLVPDDQILGKDISWKDSQKVGTKFIEDVVLGDEVGISLGGSGQDAFEIDSAIAGAVKQTEVTPYVSILPSILPFATVSRSAGGGEKAFLAATKFIVKNNLKSHNKFLETFRLYGQADALLGYVSYATATYRSVSFTNGTGTLNSIAFTNGINAASKAILLAPGSFAAGIWVGRKGVKVNQVDSTGAVVASGKLVTVNAQYGYITVDFTPVAATSTTSHRLCFNKQETQGEQIGINKILNTDGTLFAINNANFELFKGSRTALSSVKLTLGRIQDAMANAVNGGGLDGAVTLYCNPRSWATLATTEAGLRVYDKSYQESQAKNGFMDLEFYTQTGKITIKAHRHVKEGEAYILSLDNWSRSGSSQVGFSVPGMEGDNDLIRALENQAGYQFKSFSDEYTFTHSPAKSIILQGINDESAS